MSAIETYISKLPKAELHLHIEGTLEPDLMFQLARRNNMKVKYHSIDEVRSAYHFGSLQDFLDIYYAGASVLKEEIDFYDLTVAYLTKIAEQGVVHTEVFFDPQTHLTNGVPFSVVVEGIHRGLLFGQQTLGISFRLIMCFLRHLDQQSAFDVLEMAFPYRHLIYGVGLDSSERDNPPSKFSEVFQKARSMGFETVAHAGEEGPSQYIEEAICALNVSRIDHGNSCVADMHVIELLRDRGIALTMCPLSNQRLQVVPDLKNHPLREILRHQILATINSDDPAYFGGYINDNYLALARDLNLTIDEIYLLAKNSILASFLSETDKQSYLFRLKNYHESYVSNSLL